MMEYNFSKKSIFQYLVLTLGLLILILSIVSAGQLKVTDEHPFYVNDSWIPAKNLQVGDLLTTEDGKKVRITSIDDIVENVSVYNLHVNGVNNYFANDILVHNKAMQVAPIPSAGTILPSLHPTGPTVGLRSYWPDGWDGVEVINGERVISISYGMEAPAFLKTPRDFFYGTKVIRPGDKVTLLRTIIVPNEFVQDAVLLSDERVLYSYRLLATDGDWTRAYSTPFWYQPPYGGEFGVRFNPMYSVHEALHDTWNRAGGFGLSTSFNGVFIGYSPRNKLTTELVIKLEVPAEYIVPYRNVECGSYLPSEFKLNSADISKYAFIAGDTSEAEVSFIGRIPREYVKEIKVVPPNLRGQEYVDFVRDLRGY